MRVKSSVLFGLIALLCVISGVSVYKQLREVHDSWQPSDMYTGLKGMRSRTYSGVSYGNGASSDAPVLSLGARSMSGHNAAFSYAHAPVSPAISMGSTSSYGQSAVAGGNPVYATSNAEVRSFGGGGNGGGSVSMSGGVAKSSGSGAGSSVSLGVSTPSAPILAVNNNRNTNNQILPNVSGDIAMASSQAYAGIGSAMGSRSVAGRRNVPSIGGGTSDESVFMNILINICGGSADLTLTDAELWAKWIVYNASPGTAPVYWEQFLAWYQSIRTLPETPVGDAVLFVLCCALFYAIYIYVKRKKISVL